MIKNATIRLSDDAVLILSYDTDSAKLSVKEAVSGKSGNVTLTTGSKKSAPKED